MHELLGVGEDNPGPVLVPLMTEDRDHCLKREGRKRREGSLVLEEGSMTFNSWGCLVMSWLFTFLHRWITTHDIKAIVNSDNMMYLFMYWSSNGLMNVSKKYIDLVVLVWFGR